MRTDIRNREAGSAEQIAQRQAWEQRAEIQIIQHRSAEGIEIELEEAAELQPRNIDRHRAFDFARDAARSDDQRAAAAGELHELIRAVAERQRHIACRDGDGWLAGGVRGFAEREAINSPVQGSAADLIKMAMIGIHQELKEKNLRSKMTLQVHDELVFDAHKDEIEILKPIIMHHMRTAFKTTVPIEVEIGTGMNWLEAH